MKSAYNFYQLLFCFFLLLFCLPKDLLAQDQEERKWQWVKRGGSTSTIITTGNGQQESVYEIRTDSEQNIYVLSSVGAQEIDIDGNDKGDNFDNDTSRMDFILASFTCEGEYRWSKVIGGGGKERPPHIVIDAEDNIFMAGQFWNCQNDNYPPRIDNDTILANTPNSCQTLFRAKYSPEGEMLSFNLPQEPYNSTYTLNRTGSIGLKSDSEGYIYWFLMLPYGSHSYESGAFVSEAYENEGKDIFHIFKYNPQGEFVEAITPDIEVNAYFGGARTFNFEINPYNKHIYIYINHFKPETRVVIFGGQQATQAFVIASYDEHGNFLWMREDNTTDSSPKIYNLAFDDDNHIYLGGKFTMDSDLLGYIHGEQHIGPNFVMKTDPTFENIIWASHSNGGENSGISTGNAAEYGALLVANGELLYTGWGFGEEFIWGDQSHYFHPTGGLPDVLFARFDIETGACLEINNMVSDDGFQEIGTALAVDSAGDYLVGGQFNYNLFDDFGNVVYNIGAGQTDFFIAKYATQACNEPMSVEQMETVTFKIYPNPVKERLYVNNLQTSTTYSLYTINGSLVSSGQLDPEQNSLSTHALNSGLYFLKLQDQKGRTQVVKVVKE